MTSLFRLLERPDLESPVLVVVLDGWIDAGLGAQQARACIEEQVALGHEQPRLGRGLGAEILALRQEPPGSALQRGKVLLRLGVLACQRLLRVHPVCQLGKSQLTTCEGVGKGYSLPASSAS